MKGIKLRERKIDFKYMTKVIFNIAAVYALLAVFMGALGAHAIKNVIAPNLLSAYETAVFYQFIHALALLFLAVLSLQWSGNKAVLITAWLWIIGVLLFSGSLYLLAITDIKSIVGFPVGLLTPIGGSCFILGWLSFIVAINQSL